MKKNLTIYYFSGTGNAKNVTYWIKEEALGQNYNVEIVDIASIDRKKITPPPQNSHVGFCSPTHGFNFPPVMMHFIFMFPKASTNKVFLINTRAGTKFYNLYLPGLSGIALLLAALVMMAKGYSIVGMRSIDLPSNWISLHPGLNEGAIKSIYERCKLKTKGFANLILSGQRRYPALYDIVQDLLVAPVALLYYFFGRFVLAKTFYANTKCNQCNMCKNKCPVSAIKIIDKRPYWSYKCESCMKCMNGCPNNAIETGHGYTAAFLCLFYSLIVSWFWQQILKLADFTTDIAGKLGEFIIESILLMLFFFPCYFLIHYLYRLPVLKQIIDFTSLTHFKFWKRYKTAKRYR